MIQPRFDPCRFRDALRALLQATGREPRPAIGATVLCVGRVGSTQDVAREILPRGAPHGTIVVAEEQVAGRGRHGRAWRSLAGAGIWATVILRSRVPDACAHWLTLAGALAICEAARAHGARGTEIKWPNDLIVQGRKCAGVLGELTGDDRSAPVALLGLGVNLDPESVASVTAEDPPATALRTEGLSPQTGREDLLADISVRLEEALGLLHAADTASLLGRWRRLSPSSSGARVAVQETGSKEIARGSTRGLTRDGALLLEEDGTGVIREIRFGGTLRFEPPLQGSSDASRH